MGNFQGIGSLLLAVFTGYLLQRINAAKLIINPSGQTQNQPAGKGFGLTCEGEAENVDLFSEMKWRGPRGELTERSLGSIEVSNMGNKLILMFKSPTTEDSGSYNCSAVYDKIDKQTASVNLIFYQDITWEDCPEQQALVINGDGKVRCRVSANPPATITWSKDGRTLEDRYVTETDGIRVGGVTEDDKGEFVVRAMVSQTGKFQNRVIKVEVHFPPEIIDLDEKAEVVEGDEAMLQCKASGFPRPLYSWFDPDQRNLSNVEGHVVDPDTGTLTFVAYKKDQGHYTCMAKNPAGEAKRGLDLTVIVKPQIREFTNITSVENQVATFECHAFGDPVPELSIRKDGSDRPFYDGDDRIALNHRKEGEKAILSFTIQRTVRADDGLYYCTAENTGGQVEKVGHLTIEFAPVMSATPTTSIKTWNGNPVNLTCIAESIPNATITWLYMGREIRDNDMYTIYGGRNAYSNLLVRPPQEFNRDGNTAYGTYRCEATNPHGTQYINIELQEARTPGILLQTTEEKTTATTVSFKFHGPKDDGGLPVRAFVVKYYEESQPYDRAQMHEWSEGSSYILENLRPRTTYRFRFAARNDVGIGEWSEEKRITMPEESAPEPPKFITPGVNISTYPDRFNIRWTEPLDNGGKIDFFQVRYFEAEKRNNKWERVGPVDEVKVTNWENAPNFEMKKLKANTFYKVEVRAHNQYGYSFDAPMVFQTAADPSKRSQGRSPVRLPGTGHESLSNGYHSDSSGSLTSGAIAAIVFVLVLIFLVALDIVCYVRYEKGFLYLIRNRACEKRIGNNKAKEAAVEEGKGKGDNVEKKSKTEVDNPAFDKEKEQLRLKEETEKDNDGEIATEETPMIQTSGAKDTKPNDGTTDEMKNKSPKGSKSSIAKDSLV